MSLIDFKNEDEVKEYLDNLATEYRFICFHEKNAEGCHLLGDFLEAVRMDINGAVKVFKDNCDERNYPKSCFKYAGFSVLGKGCSENHVAAVNYYKKACDLGHMEACLHCGVMLTAKQKTENSKGPPVKLDLATGLKYLDKACSGGNANACYFASGLYIRGAEGIPKDTSKAAELSVAACNGGNIFACMNACRMYQNGDGVVKDEEKANMFKQKARDIRDDNKRKPNLGLQQYT